MKIALLRELNPFFESSASGNRFASLIKGLSNNGIDVTIIVTRGYNTPAEKIKFNKTSNYEGINIIYLVPLLNHKLWLRRINKYILSPVIEKIVNRRLKKIFFNKYDYIWLTNTYPILNFFNKYASKLEGLKSIIEINEFHDIYIQEGSITNKAQLGYAQKNIDSFLEAISKIDCFAIMTKTLLDFYRPIAKPKAAFIHLPMTVDLTRFENIEIEKNSKPYIAFAGSLNNKKEGIDILIRAFSKILTKYPDIELKLAGPYSPDTTSQKDIINELNIESNVRFIGELNRNDIPKYLCNAKVLVLSRPNSHQAQGGFPTKLGEYLATGNPLCVTNVGEISDYLEDNISAFIATPGDVDSFADALCRALSNNNKARKIGKAGHDVAYKKFNMDVQAKHLKDFLIINLKN